MQLSAYSHGIYILNLMALKIMHEDDDLLVVNKPAGLVCHPTKGDEFSSLISRARLHLKSSAVPQLVNRLDRETSGIVLIAKSTTATKELGGIFASRDVTKEYLAIVHGSVSADSGVIEAPLGKDIGSAVAIKDTVRPDGAVAQTEYQTLSRFTREEGDFTFLRLLPRTGRKHQLRIHLAHIGHSIVGDKLYGIVPEAYLAFVQYRLTEQQRQQLIFDNQALHAHRLQFTWREKQWEFAAPPEPWFTDFLPSSFHAICA